LTVDIKKVRWAGGGGPAVEVGSELANGEASREREQKKPPRTFVLAALVLPGRLCKEDLGDALEVVARLRDHDAPAWQVRLKIISTLFWLVINTARELTSVVHGSASKGSSRDE
jgi:hypothetical protein